MKRYAEYKKTNSNFIPDIPTHWKKLRVKNLVDRNQYYPVGDGDHGSIKPEMYLEEGIPYIRVQNLSWTGELSLDNVVYISEKVQKANSKSILRPGDILIAKTGATVGKLGLIPNNLKEANTTSSVGKLTVDESKFNPKYILYSFQAKHFNDQIWMQASQKSAQPGFNIDDLIEFEIASPELEEQSKIAVFLDYKTNLIDATIEKKKRIIELLKEKRQVVINEAVTKGLNPNTPMKNSGVERLGEIPEHWETSKLKFLVDENLKYGANESAEDDNPNNPRYIRITDFGDDGILRENTFKSLEYNIAKEYFLKEGDILFARSGATVGKTFQFKNYDGLACFAGYLIKASVNKKITSDFLYYFTKTNLYENWKNSIFVQATIQNISAEKYNNLIVCFPKNREEQIMINNHIETECKKIDLILNNIYSAIQKLHDYRQSLISEAVTGKIDVRDWQVN